MDKHQAGSKGGKTTVERHGREHMQEIGKRGAAVTWEKYHLSPIGQSGWAMIDRETNQVKTFVNFIPGR
jgi:general stress protein YciG